MKSSYEERIAELQSLTFAAKKTAEAKPRNDGKYGVAGFDDDDAFEKFYKALTRAIAKEDRKWTASLLGYPIQINNFGFTYFRSIFSQ